MEGRDGQRCVGPQVVQGVDTQPNHGVYQFQSTFVKFYGNAPRRLCWAVQHVAGCRRRIDWVSEYMILEAVE